MMVATHKLGGFTIGVLMASGYPGDYFRQGIIIGTALIGSLLPDIDHPGSYISHKAKVLRTGTELVQGTTRLLSGFLPGKARKQIRSMAVHRGLAHSLAALLVLSGIIYFFDPPAGMAMVAGMGSHLLLDLFSGGVPLFMPLIQEKFCIARIKTGGAAEWIFRGIWILILGMIFFHNI